MNTNDFLNIIFIKVDLNNNNDKISEKLFFYQKPWT